MTDMIWAMLIGIAILIAFSFFFSGSETALTAASRARMHALSKAGNQRAAIVERLIETREKLLGALLIGNNLVNILASALATSVFLTLFGQTGVAYATIVMTVIVVVFAEVLPKTWAINAPDRFALAVSPAVRLVVALFGPPSHAVGAIVRAILRLIGVSVDASRPVLSAQEELRGAVDLLHREGSVVKGDRDMLGGILDLSDLEVSDIMIHRTKMRMINADDPPEEIVRQVLASPHTRLPLWQGEPDNIVGILHAKDLLRALAAVGGDASLLDVKAVTAAPWFVPDTTSVRDQLSAFLK